MVEGHLNPGLSTPCFNLGILQPQTFQQWTFQPHGLKNFGWKVLGEKVHGWKVMVEKSRVKAWGWKVRGKDVFQPTWWHWDEVKTIGRLFWNCYENVENAFVELQE